MFNIAICMDDWAEQNLATSVDRSVIGVHADARDAHMFEVGRSCMGTTIDKTKNSYRLVTVSESQTRALKEREILPSFGL